MEYYEFDDSEKPEFVFILDISAEDWKPKLKILTEYDLIAVENGEIEVLCDEKTYILGKFNYILAHPGQTICITKKNTSDTRAWILHFRFKMHRINNTVSSVKNTDIIIPKLSSCAESNAFTYIHLLYGEVVYRAHGFRKLLNDLTWHVLFELERSYYINRKFEKISVNVETGVSYYIKIIDYLHKFYGKKIQASDIEKLVDLNYDYVNTLFKKITGKTIMASLLSLRMSVATELMNTTDFNIQEIAEMCGFEDSRYFSRRFKQLYNTTPSAYREFNKLEI
ncbi:MAG: helix-turn-helix transcriptional regulator [Eubacteriales bacterium]